MDAAFDDDPVARRSTDRSKNRQWRSSGHAAGASHDDDRDRRAGIARHQQRHGGRHQGEIDQVAGESIRGPLDGRPAVLRPFDRVDDSAERRVSADPLRLNLDRTGLIDGAGKYALPLALGDGHGLAGDRRLIDEGLAAEDETVDGDTAARQDHDAIQLAKLLDGDVGELAIPPHPHSTG